MNPIKRSSPLYVTCLLAVGLVVGRFIPPLAVRFDGQAPRPSMMAAVMLAICAFGVAWAAWWMWTSVHRHNRWMASRVGIRMLALAKASVMVGGIFAGGYGGFAFAYWGVESELGRERLLNGGLAALASLALLIAALLLERACQIPTDPDDQLPTAPEAS